MGKGTWRAHTGSAYGTATLILLKDGTMELKLDHRTFYSNSERIKGNTEKCLQYATAKMRQEDPTYTPDVIFHPPSTSDSYGVTVIRFPDRSPRQPFVIKTASPDPESKGGWWPFNR